MAEKQSKNKWHTPAERIMMLGFAAVILLGTILLCLPVSAADGKSVYWIDALFTATTSVCVTGLVTVPTATTWSVFGKIVILGLIQFGGLGIMACLTMIFLVLRRRPASTGWPSRFTTSGGCRGRSPHPARCSWARISACTEACSPRWPMP